MSGNGIETKKKRKQFQVLPVIYTVAKTQRDTPIFGVLEKKDADRCLKVAGRRIKTISAERTNPVSPKNLIPRRETRIV